MATPFGLRPGPLVPAIFAAALLGGCAAPAAPAVPAASGPASADEAWRDMLAPPALERWQSTAFGGEGEVTIEPGEVHLEFGTPMTGITWNGPFPESADGSKNYELALQATRIEGTDFFCGLTFPVRGEHLTLVVGGWGAGTVVGLSSLDGFDASENETRSYRSFELGRPYAIGLRVEDGVVTVTIDGETVIDVDTNGRLLSLRPEVDLSRPLGIAAFRTRAVIRDVRWRPL